MIPPIAITLTLDITDTLAQALHALARAVAGHDVSALATLPSNPTVAPPPERSQREAVRAIPARLPVDEKDRGTLASRFIRRPWTADRLAELARLIKEGGHTPPTMLPMIAALPGPELDARSIGNKAYQIRKRNKRADPPASPSNNPELARSPLVPKTPTSGLAVRRIDIEAWCRQADVQFRSLDFVNRQRAKRELVPFVEMDGRTPTGMTP